MKPVLHIQHQNPFLQNTTAEEITALEISTLNGVSNAIKFFDRTTGRKTHQYYFSTINEEKTIVISIIYEDVIVDDKRTGINKTFTWFSPLSNGHISKIKFIEFNAFTNYEEDVKRRKNIQDEIVVQALTSDYLFFKPLLDEIFDLTSKELEIWRRTGNSTPFHNVLDSASNSVNTEIEQLFAGTPFSAVNSLKKVLTMLPATDELIVDANGDKLTDVKLIDNLKFFIK